MSTENKIIHILKHAESKDPKRNFDLYLTYEGAGEASNMIEKFSPSMKAPALVLVPPLKRCMETALKAFHPNFNYNLHFLASETPAEKTDGNELMRHFAKGNVTFMLDPRLQEIISDWREDGPDGRATMPSRREMHSVYKRYFIFPEEFYPKCSEEQLDDPDKDQDWYKEEGMWTRGFHRVETLERVASFKEFLYNRPEKEIIVITCRDFRNTLTNDKYNYTNKDILTCIWKPTVSGRMRLVALTSSESQQDVLKDEDYSEYWPYRSGERSELFNKWYTKPLKKMFKALFEFEERKKYLGLDKLTLDSLEAELGPELVQKVKDEVTGKKDEVTGKIDYCL